MYMFTLLFVHRSDQLLQKISSFRIAQKPGKSFHVRGIRFFGFLCFWNCVGIFSFPGIKRVLKKLGIDSAVIIQNTTRRLPMRKQKP